MITRRTSIALTGAALVGPSLARAQPSWPTATVRLVVPFAAGGPTDLIGRLIADRLKTEIGGAVIVENRPGANGNIGSAAVAADEDGHSILFATGTMYALNPTLYGTDRIDISRDCVGLATVAALPNVLIVNPATVKATSVAELIALGRSQPRKLTFGTFGVGSSPHVTATLLQRMGGFEAVNVPFAGSAPALNAVLSGHLDFLFDNVTTSAPQVQAGTVRALGVTSAFRVAGLPDLPTMQEAGLKDFEFSGWFATFASRKTAAPVVDRMRAAVSATVSSPEYASVLRARGAEPFVTAPGALDAFLSGEKARWETFARENGIHRS